MVAEWISRLFFGAKFKKNPAMWKGLQPRWAVEQGCLDRAAQAQDGLRDQPSQGLGKSEKIKTRVKMQYSKVVALRIFVQIVSLNIQKSDVWLSKPHVTFFLICLGLEASTKRPRCIPKCSINHRIVDSDKQLQIAVYFKSCFYLLFAIFH